MIKNTQTPLNKDEQKRLNQIVQQLIDSNDSVEFRQPVDYKRLNLPDYIQIVKRPMDLGTVQFKLNNNTYKTVEECLDEIQLIWDNCKLYNGPQSWITKIAEKLERLFKKNVKNYLPLVNLPQVVPKTKEITSDVYQEEPQEQVTYNDKVEFSNNLKQLAPEQIGLIVHMIQNTSPNAFVEIEREKYQIIVDNIEYEAFTKCQQQIQAWILGDDINKKVKI
ncbi:unnamed protein product [Paramecium octaurelia]|uniref:Bromo domain-containing protein n=1 Tax=Paramecium octaurelia TaxID=43137 RepID=A0A8S1V2R1_PAROT|nr:unnamed protein product [Paramecium octaurelia]